MERKRWEGESLEEVQGVLILGWCSRSCDRPQADRVRGKLREFVARRCGPGTDGMTAGAELLPAGYSDMSVYRFAMEKEEQL